jgi:hypothetical protein
MGARGGKALILSKYLGIAMGKYAWRSDLRGHSVSVKDWNPEHLGPSPHLWSKEQVGRQLVNWGVGLPSWEALLLLLLMENSSPSHNHLHPFPASACCLCCDPQEWPGGWKYLGGTGSRTWVLSRCGVTSSGLPLQVKTKFNKLRGHRGPPLHFSLPSYQWRADQ